MKHKAPLWLYLLFVVAIAAGWWAFVQMDMAPRTAPVVVREVVITATPAPTVEPTSTPRSADARDLAHVPTERELIWLARFMAIECGTGPGANRDCALSTVSTLFRRMRDYQNGAHSWEALSFGDLRSTLLWGVFDDNQQQFQKCSIPPEDMGMKAENWTDAKGNPCATVDQLDTRQQHEWVLDYLTGERGSCDGFLFFWSIPLEERPVPVLCEIYDEYTDRTVRFFDTWDVEVSHG